MQLAQRFLDGRLRLLRFLLVLQRRGSLAPGSGHLLRLLLQLAQTLLPQPPLAVQLLQAAPRLLQLLLDGAQLRQLRLQLLLLLLKRLLLRLQLLPLRSHLRHPFCLLLQALLLLL